MHATKWLNRENIKLSEISLSPTHPHISEMSKLYQMMKLVKLLQWFANV